MKVTDDMNRLVPSKVQDAVDKLAKSEESPKVEEIKEMIKDIQKKLYGAIDNVEKRLDKLEKPSADIVNGKDFGEMVNEFEVQITKDINDNLDKKKIKRSPENIKAVANELKKNNDEGTESEIKDVVNELFSKPSDVNKAKKSKKKD